MPDGVRYTPGDGADIVVDTRVSDPAAIGDHNTLTLNGIDPADVILVREDNGVRVLLPDGGNIMLERQLAVELPHRNQPGASAGGVSMIVFEGGVTWDADAIRSMVGFVVPRPPPIGTDGDDIMVGDYWEDDIFGGAGNDQIQGGDASDYLRVRLKIRERANLMRCQPAPPPDHPSGYRVGGREGERAGTAKRALGAFSNRL